MTKEELDKMTPEEKRIRIAELCGWCDVTQGVGPNRDLFLGSEPQRDDSGKIWAYDTDRVVPDYLNDLNAMAEAENLHFTKPENAGLANTYRGWLVNMNWEGPKGFDYSASERADAFLLTLG